ncbi:hypothetical protein BC936DRAFT_138912 [Jimgerdemannia flammicorona]|uniref:Uncharacterized protein n=1 Tax=Jimgerdemannia flammicorona TaxID=994334 RepID=A0A433BDU3_9FUNG|nr:hypothetical protein BC936DRAFT_138912 [Jimgerdemannia flammicorona]
MSFLQPRALLFHVHILRLQDCLASTTPLQPRLTSSTVLLASLTAHLATSRPSCLVNCSPTASCLFNHAPGPIKTALPLQDRLSSNRITSQPLLPPKYALFVCHLQLLHLHILTSLFLLLSIGLVFLDEASSSYFEDTHPSEWSYLGFLEALKSV